MVPIPKPQPSTVRAIYEAYKQSNEHFDSLGISVGEIGTECDRALWFGFRWASQPEEIDGRKISIFRTGDMWEDRMVADLEAIGAEVFDQQNRIRLVGGHVRGKIDGKAIGLPEAPKTIHLMEFKSSNTENFKDVQKKGCKESKPLHYGQCQIGMHAEGLDRCGYLVTDKDTDKRYFERIEYDPVYCMRQLARAERIIMMDEPPSRLCNKRDDFRGMFCKHAAVCWAEAWSRVTCRSCLHATPTMDGDAAWNCSRWSKPLSVDEQKQACGAHLYVPALVPGGEQVDVDEENEVVVYRMPDGTLYRDGATEENNAA
jgi:hypothetical protein